MHSIRINDLERGPIKVPFSHQAKALQALNKVYKMEDPSSKSGLLVIPTGERVIIVTGCINALVSRVSGTFIKNNSCIA